MKNSDSKNTSSNLSAAKPQSVSGKVSGKVSGRASVSSEISMEVKGLAGKSRIYSLLVTGLFLLFFGGLSLVSLIMPDKTFSPLENRNLSGAPSFSFDQLMSGRFMTDAESYVSDQIAFRDGWVALRAFSERLSGKKENNGVYFGTKDTLLNKIEEPDANRLAKNINFVNTLCQNSQPPVYLGIIPSSTSVWSDRLPYGAPSADELSLIGKLYANTTATTIDMADAMLSHKEDEIYYRSDHHWTSLGAFYGANAIFQGMELDILNLADYEKTTVSDQFYGTSYSSASARWMKPDTIDTYIPDKNIEVISNFSGKPVKGSLYVDSFLDQKNKYAYFLGGNQPLCVIRSANAKTDQKLLVIRDSYSDSLAPFLTENFAEVHLFDPRYNMTSVRDYITEHEIDRVLVLYSFSNFASETNMFVIAR